MLGSVPEGGRVAEHSAKGFRQCTTAYSNANKEIAILVLVSDLYCFDCIPSARRWHGGFELHVLLGSNRSHQSAWIASTFGVRWDSRD